MSAGTPAPLSSYQGSALVEKDGMESSQRHRLALFEAQKLALRRKEADTAAAIARDLQEHPGFYPAAVARNKQLLVAHAKRPDLHWASSRWAEIFNHHGLPEVLRMLADPDQHQELLSASPFYLMRPPLPENDFYQAHVPSKARH
jgi:hypothetical protein